MFYVDPIGYFHSASSATYDVPRQASLSPDNEGVIILEPGLQFEQALDGLDGFDRLWIVYRFHRNAHWKPKVLPPRGGKKQGVFATRSPHRPNFIGLSCVELIAIKKLKVFVRNHDLIDGTPILDLKPYLNYADAHTSLRQGWLDTLEPEKEFSVIWSSYAQEQIDYLESQWKCSLKDGVTHRLKFSPMPYPSNRVKAVGDGDYVLAYRTWRISFHIDEDYLNINTIASGYDQETLDGIKPSQWDDVPIHQAFVKQFDNTKPGR